MKIAVCDDSEKERKAIHCFCNRYAKENKLDFYISLFECGKKLLESQNYEFDLIILDILMGHMSGVEIARKLLRYGYEGAFVFAATSSEFYAEGFEVGAVHYLVKPLAYDEVASALSRAVKRTNVSEEYLEVMSERVLTKVLVKNIMYIEVYGHETVIHTIKGRLKVNLSLSGIAQKLKYPPFVKCYRSYIVNMDYVRQVKSESFFMENGEVIPIAKKSRLQIRQLYLNYILGPAVKNEEIVLP